MKRYLCSLLCILCLFLSVQSSYADTVRLSDQPILDGTQETAQTDSSEKAATQPGTAKEAGIPQPEIASEGCALYDATTGRFLYTKNADKQLYPASITKVMTVLLAAEKLSPDSVITFKASATENLESGYTNVGIVTGDTMTVKDAMYAVMLKSACEVSNGLAEQVSGTQKAFAELMNKRAKELGCTNTDFRNASGLNDTKHMTTAHDMALIMAKAMDNSTFYKVVTTKNYTLPASKKRGSLKLTNSNKMLYSSNGEYVEGILGGKTGYTSKAGNTLVEAADIGGHRLITVVMKSNGKQYTDTKKLFEYGRQLLTGVKSGS